MSISIIVVNYNTSKLTDECLESLSKIQTKDYSVQVVVVDNASEKKYSLPSSVLSSSSIQYSLLRTEENKGFSGGNNKGIRYTLKKHSPDYILLLNNDTTVDKKFLTRLVAFAQNKDDLGAVCPLIYFEKGYEFHKQHYQNKNLGNIIWYAGGSIDWKNMYAFHRGVDEVDRGQFNIQEKTKKQKYVLPSYKPDDKVAFATGCCVLFPTKVLRKVGLLNEKYFLYWEDVELSQRIRDAGYTLYFCPHSKIYHKNAGSSSSGSQLHTYYQTRNRLWFGLTHAPWKTKLALLKQSVIQYYQGTKVEKKAVRQGIMRFRSSS